MEIWQIALIAIVGLLFLLFLISEEEYTQKRQEILAKDL